MPQWRVLLKKAGKRYAINQKACDNSMAVLGK